MVLVRLLDDVSSAVFQHSFRPWRPLAHCLTQTSRHHYQNRSVVHFLGTEIISMDRANTVHHQMLHSFVLICTQSVLYNCVHPGCHLLDTNIVSLKGESIDLVCVWYAYIIWLIMPTTDPNNGWLVDWCRFFLSSSSVKAIESFRLRIYGGLRRVGLVQQSPAFNWLSIIWWYFIMELFEQTYMKSGNGIEMETETERERTGGACLVLRCVGFIARQSDPFRG